MRKILFGSIALITSSMMVFGAPVLARAAIADRNPDDGASSDDISSNETRKEAISEKLEANRLRVCQKHEAVINSIMGRISERGQRRLNVYSTIAERVEDFYTKKGKTLSNYDELVNDVKSKKDAAQAAVDQIKGDSVDFKCDGTDPKGVASSFKADLKLEIQSLHAYQQSIKNLIVGVKSVQSDNTSDNSSDGGEQ
ncbi:MAG TPA: hypothetical protein VLG25_00020 [Patescibacteria group bacterium]|nr:hypothetical protein [Patescibacteria group bacterium]